ncbi:hypothetical protein MCUN1_002260 [Malassezia cuniculi]|uniref:Uncharacterized protein n=1 Tax=Malassezia cuniculi TaxID=948313 RepID=A0AAF0ERP1_9BASI|nr:hypothetical protein MCUN1_002260 [Malassezia cuniculi]
MERQAAAGRGRCWATLLTHAQYLPGVAVLVRSLAQHGTRYPLVVMTTDEVDVETRDVLGAMGCVVRDVPCWTVDVPSGEMASARFVNVWTKLRAFGLVEYERVVLIDSDMLVCGAVDELMEIDLPDGCIAACSACTCNPNGVPTYPAHWVPENCAYSARESGAELSYPMPVPPDAHGLLNSGLVVLVPSAEQEQALHCFLDQHAEHVGKYKFPDQDLLADVYAGRWLPLPWYYNALKTLRRCHAGMWDDSKVRVVHYILEYVETNQD